MDEERVEYSFTGDVSDLKAATKEAISLLDQYEGTVKGLAKSGDLEVGKTAFTSFQRTVNGIIKQVNSLSGFMNKASQENQNALVPNTEAIESAYSGISDALNFLQTSTKVTTDDLKLITLVLQDTKNVLDPITAKAQALGATFGNVAQMTEQSMQKVDSSVKSTAQQSSADIETLGQKWDNYSHRMSKSAEMSAQVFADAGKFTGFITGAENVASKIILMRSSIDNEVNKIINRIRSLTSVFDPVTSKIQSFKDKASEAGNRVSQAFSTIASAFRRTSDGTEGASASQNKYNKSIDSSSEKLGKHKKQLHEVSQSYTDTKGAAEDAYSSMSEGAQSLSGPFGAIKSLVTGITDAFLMLAGVDMGSFLADGAKEAISYVENMNLFEVAMGSSIDKGRAFVNQMQEVYGMDPSNIARHAGYFYQLTDAIGMSEEASASVSLSMTKAANDIASLFNDDIQTVVDNLSAGMQGMSRAVRKYGMDIRTTTLQQTAYQYGLEGSVENMSEANREALRYITMLQQVQNALHQTTTAVDGTTTELGDFARNIETPANQLRIFKEQMSQLGRAVGSFIVAPLAKALPFINGFVMALRTLVNFIASLLGVSVDAGSSLSGVGESAEDAASGVDSIGGAADKASKKLKQLIAPFDELNVLQESTDDDSGSGGGGGISTGLDPALAEALASMELNLENIKMKANQVRDSILEFLGLKVTTDPITGEQIIQWDKEAFKTNVLDSLDAFKKWFDNLDPFIQFVITAAGVASAIGIVGSVASAIPTILSVLAAAFTALTSPVALVAIALAALLTFSESFREAFVDILLKVGKSVGEWGNILKDVFTTVGKDLVKMWDTHIEPTIKAIGDALAPALDTLGSLWENLSTIVSDIFAKIGDLWKTVLKPVIEGAMEIIQDLANKFKTLWEEYVGPVVEYIGDGLEDLWTNSFSPVIDKIIALLGEFWEMIMALWNNVLSPLIDWLIGTLGPKFKSVFTGVWDVVKPIIANMVGAVGGVIEQFRGLIKFLTGVFTGDWKKAWEGIKQIFKGIFDSFVNIVKIPINLILGLINGMISAVESGLNWIIRGINKISFDVPDWVPVIGGKEFGFSLDAVSLGRVSYLAKGGVVTGPTPAMIGEGKYSEAVIPLDDSPQMNDLINKIVEAINKDDPSPQPVEVKVYIGDKEYDAYTYKAAERGKKIVGKQPVKIGG